VKFIAMLLMFTAAGAAMAFQNEVKVNPRGYLYGEVTMKTGNTYRGPMRWGTEEIFWDDLFNSSKEEIPFEEFVPEKALSRKREIKVFGYKVATYRDRDRLTRQFIARFGDIERIRTAGGNGADVYMKSGAKIYVRGFSNDVGADITVWDATIGKIELNWKRIDVIQFMAVPPDAPLTAPRLQGKVETDIGDFEGFIQWDAQEAIGTDKLDGETPDGDLSIDMAGIRSIERRNSGSSLVTLKDGRELVMRGSNDVNDDNRGIYIEDARYGRVKVTWERFRKATFVDSGDTGRGYDDFKPLGELKGSVVAKAGRSAKGRLVYDIDEAEGWEMLNGNIDKVEYTIPFSMIAAIAPRRDYAAVVTLRNGETLTLEDAVDVNDGNLGLLVFAKDGGEPEYFNWDDIEKIEF